MDNRARQELDTLLSMLVDGNLGQEQQRLGELLEKDPEARDIYLAYFTIHSELSLTGGLSNAIQYPSSDPVFLPSAKKTFLRARPVRRFFSGVAAIIVLFVSVWFVFSPRTGPSTPVIAKLVSAENARWAHSPAYADMNGKFTAGDIHIEEGDAHIRMVSGVELVLKGPTIIELVDAAAVRLKQGTLTVSVVDESAGFRVLTPTANLVDMGTEFGVEVKESGTTEVHVFQGTVVAKSTVLGSVIPIAAQEAGRIDMPRDRRDPTCGEFMSVELDRSRFRGLAKSAVDAAAVPETRPPGQMVAPLAAGARIVFLGDQATSRETHLLLVNQALSNLPFDAVPQLFNAAWAFPLSFKEEHYRESVESFTPTHAVIEFGPEIAASSNPRSIEDFRQAITRLVDRLERSDIEPVIATGFAIPQTNPRAQELLHSYNDFLRELASQRNYRLADVDRKSRRYPDCEPKLANTDFAPTFEGFSVMAAALLESFGYSELSVPRALDVSLLPGVVTNWRMRVRPHDDRLDAESVARLTIDETWTRLSLPQQDKLSQRLAQPGRSFVQHDRARGFATHLTEANGQIVQAIAYCESERDRDVFINTGARLLNVWLNGEQVYHSDNPWAGWHPGKERIPARLKAGRNQIVVESQDAFFLSITDHRDWALPRPVKPITPKKG